MSGPVQISFGTWLKERRREAGITQDELAGRIDCAPITLQKIVSGKRRPSRQIALLLAAYFGVPEDEQEAFVTFARAHIPTRSISSTTSHPADPAYPIDQTTEARANSSQNVPWRTIHLSRSNLPLVLTTLIGREHELDEVCRLLAQRKVRLLTLTGSPGTGKTHLSIEVAATLLGDFEDGVYLVELATLSEAAMVIPSIARTLDLRETGGQSIEETLLAHIKDKRMLLLLDNFEHLLDASPEVVKLIQASPWLKVLVTSREALHVRGERQYSLSPLSLPVLADRPSLEELARNPAVELFVERAQDTEADFALTQENALDVAEVCINLDGLPLAIELAAGRVSLFPPRTLLSRLGRQLEVLARGSRDLPPRQRTLRGAIEWSYNLLDQRQRQLFRSMAVFSGGHTLEGLEAICNSEGLRDKGKELKVEVLSGMETLLSSNLMHQREGSDGEPRFWMLETIHEYARERLRESEEAEALQREHALYFMRLAEEAEPHMGGKEDHEWLEKLDDEYDNLRAALAWAGTTARRVNLDGQLNSQESTHQSSVGDSQEGAWIGLRILGAIWRFWYERALYTEGREQLERILSLPEGLLQACSPGSRAIALNAAGVLAGEQGDYSLDRTFSEAALVLGREAGDKKSIAASLVNLAVVALQPGDYTTARARFEESLALRRELGDKQGTARSLLSLGLVALLQGEFTEARALFEESLGIMREFGNKADIAMTLNNLALVALQQGDYMGARALHEESLALRREFGDKSGIAMSLTNLGSLALQQGDHAEARTLLEESLALWRSFGIKSGIATSLTSLGSLALQQGDHAEARTLLEEALALQREIGSKKGIAACLGGLGGVAIGVGQIDRGAKLLGAVEGLLSSIGATMDRSDLLPYERAAASARSLLGDEACERAWQEGRRMSLEEAIEYARQES